MYNPEVPRWSLCIVVFLLDFPSDNPSSLPRSLAVTVPELWCSRVVSQTLSTERFLAIRGEVGKRRGKKNMAAALGLGRRLPVTVWLMLSHTHTEKSLQQCVLLLKAETAACSPY